MMTALDRCFETYLKIPRIKHGTRQTLEMLITEEAYLLANYLRDARATWNPRIVEF